MAYCSQCGKEIVGTGACECGAEVCDEKKYTVGFWTYFGLTVLFALPLIGLIAAIVFSFAPKNKSLKNYARVMMTWGIVGLVICGLLVGAAVFAIRAVMNLTAGSSYGFLPELGAFADILKDIPKEDLQKILEEYRNGDYDALYQRFLNGEFGNPDELMDRFENGEFGDLGGILNGIGSGEAGDPSADFGSMASTDGAGAGT